MAKYSYEFKRQVVLEYLQGEIGYKALAKKHHISSHSEIEKWIAAYRIKGEDGLHRSRQQKTYPFEFKLHAVELYLSTETSYRELAATLGMTEPSLLAAWVSRYRAIGIDGLRPQQKGRQRKVTTPNLPRKPQNEQETYIRQLEQENLRLRIENACLKELRRLRLAQQAQRQKQGLPTVSEDPAS